MRSRTDLEVGLGFLGSLHSPKGPKYDYSGTWTLRVTFCFYVRVGITLQPYAGRRVRGQTLEGMLIRKLVKRGFPKIGDPDNRTLNRIFGNSQMDLY